jgi:hypothetical protein
MPQVLQQIAVAFFVEPGAAAAGEFESNDADRKSIDPLVKRR